MKEDRPCVRAMEQEPAESTKESGHDNLVGLSSEVPSAKLESLFLPLPQNEENSSILRDPLLISARDESSSSSSLPSHEQGGEDSTSRRTSRQDESLWQPLFHFLRRRGLWSDDSRRYFREVIRRSGNYLAYATLLTMLVVLPQIIYRGIKDERILSATYNSAGVMVLATIVLSFRQVYLHLTHWYMPQVQKYVVRILWMVPLYAVQSWLSLRFHSSRIYIDTIRDLYEAYVIASFVYYLIELLGGEEGLIHILEGKDNPALGHHTFPLQLILEPWDLGEDFMLQCKHGVLQYVVFKVVATCFTLLFEFIGIYGEGEFHWMVAYPYLVVFQNMSVCYALYCLVMLYSAVDEELRHPINWRPLGKFLCVKGVVFFCWWQGVLIFYLQAHGIINGAGSRWSAQDVANGLIDYCIVLEMVLFAIAHSYTFTYKEYLPSSMPPEYFTQQQDDNEEASLFRAENGDAPEGDVCDAVSCPAVIRNSDDAEQPQEPPSIPPPTRLQTSQSDGSITRTSPRVYRPPAVLDRPMGFTDAFWSSTLPRETIEDIQRLRVGRELVVALRPRTGSQESAGRRLVAESATAAVVVASVDSSESTNDLSPEEVPPSAHNE